LLGLLIVTFFTGCQKNASEPGDTLIYDSQSAKFIGIDKDNFIVIAKSEMLPEGLEKKLSAYGEILRVMPEIGQVVIKPKDSKFEAKVSKLSQVQAVVSDIMIRWIEPDKFVSEGNPPSIGSNEPYFFYQWGMDAINAPEAWNAGFTGGTARVFILDSGIGRVNAFRAVTE